LGKEEGEGQGQRLDQSPSRGTKRKREGEERMTERRSMILYLVQDIGLLEFIGKLAKIALDSRGGDILVFCSLFFIFIICKSEGTGPWVNWAGTKNRKSLGGGR
jgi:hypothetical protein